MAKLHKLFSSVSCLVVTLSMLLTACTPAATPTPAVVAPTEPASNRSAS